jgi:hypothetical protein
MTFHPFLFYGIKNVLGMLEYRNDERVAIRRENPAGLIKGLIIE